MTTDFLCNFIREHKHGVLASVSADSVPESAYVEIVVTPDLKIVFAIVSDSRKYKNLLLDPNVAFVIGWDNEQTVQYEGTAKLLNTNEQDKLLQTYFEAFPDGKDREENWKNIVHFCVEPKWIRYSDFNDPTKQIIEETKF